MNLGTEPVSLDWQVANDYPSFDVISNLMIGLTRFDANSDSEPACASSWEISADNTEYIFHLNPEVKWTDGVPVKAQHFVDAFVRLLDPMTAAPYADLASMIDTKLTKAIDDQTLFVKLKRPAAYFLNLTSFGLMYPIRIDLIKKYGDNWIEPENMITNGPYKLLEWQHEYKIVLQRNDEFGLPSRIDEPGHKRLKYLKFFMVPEQSSAYTLFRNKQFDWVDRRSIPSSEMRKINAIEKGELEDQIKPENIMRAALLRNSYIGFNSVKAPFDDARMRQAFSYALDRTVFPKVLQRGEIPNSTWIPLGLKDYHDKSRGLGYKPELARKLLAELGYPGGNNFPEIEFWFPNTEANKLIAETAQSMWRKELGITVKLVNMEWKVYLDTLNRDPPEIFRLNWGADYPDPDTFMQLFLTTNQMNEGKWSNQEYDQIVMQAGQITDLARRQKLYKRAEDILTKEEMAIAPLFIDSQVVLMQDNIKGFTINSMDNVFLDKVYKVENKDK